MSGEKKQKPEDLLAKLRKIEDNKHCANCGDYAKLGHTNVCGILFAAYFLFFSSLQLFRVPHV